MRWISVLSGKGGAGKSSITASLAIAISKRHTIICADCDVDAPNLALVLGSDNMIEREALSTSMKADIDEKKCNGCGKCKDACTFEAITIEEGKAMINRHICEGCKACSLACPNDAIQRKKIQNGEAVCIETAYGFKIVAGQLAPGESGSGKIVTKVRLMAERIGEGCDLALSDSSAGIGCPVIASVSGSDYAIIVAEPTPSGFSDMKRAIEMTEILKVPSGIIINKHSINPMISDKIITLAKEKRSPILAKIGYDKDFIDALVKRTPIIDFQPNYKPLFEGIVDKLEEMKIIERR
ncbi:P-loop ATPase [Candidatus Woesearchaeota archaeon CG11_big_fil_rev_8_21_14_0_20_43_8]|nr:MAG: P-loop ATPase [Candidatus Woesearchaeota archaeon CG11_big_fil_rev_8_21_14_0_20_43_8]PIO07568.1 MAG: P-loop ATPase [Candidatus Woesearchaeota archaeon CG08_land_8_20_14_0_20_43_7]